MWSCLIALTLTLPTPLQSMHAVTELTCLDGACKSAQEPRTAHRDPPDDYVAQTASRLA